jgi:hypothetical protein
LLGFWGDRGKDRRRSEVFYMNRKEMGCTVAGAPDPAVCTVEELRDGRVVFSAVSVGHARVDVDDSAVRKERIDVYVISAS